jgi:hypothetical protein
VGGSKLRTIVPKSKLPEATVEEVWKQKFALKSLRRPKTLDTKEDETSKDV